MFNEQSIAKSFILQMCDEWGNPSPGQKVVVALKNPNSSLKVSSTHQTTCRETGNAAVARRYEPMLTKVDSFSFFQLRLSAASQPVDLEGRATFIVDNLSGPK